MHASDLSVEALIEIASELPTEVLANELLLREGVRSVVIGGGMKVGAEFDGPATVILVDDSE